MSDKSPLFVSSLELLVHATELYTGGDQKKYKFVILHLANSIELLLKDCLIDHRVSIYKGPKETISIWAAFQELEKLNILCPEKAVIELLVDDRNTIQHRFGFPNGETVYYYLEQTVIFFTRFLKAQYRLEIAEVLKPYLNDEQLALLGIKVSNYTHLKKLFELSPESAVVQAYETIEAKIWQFVYPGALRDKRSGYRLIPAAFLLLLADLASVGLVRQEMVEKFDFIQSSRNTVAHSNTGKTPKEELSEVLDAATDLLNTLDKLHQDGRLHINKYDADSIYQELYKLSPRAAMTQVSHELWREFERSRTSRRWYTILRTPASSGATQWDMLINWLISKEYLPDSLAYSTAMMSLRNDASTPIDIQTYELWIQLLLAFRKAKSEQKLVQNITIGEVVIESPNADPGNLASAAELSQ